MNCQEIKEHIIGIFHNEQIPPKPSGKLTRAQTKEHQESVQKVREINQKRGRERFKITISGLMLGAAGLGLILSFNAPDQAKQVFITPNIDKTPITNMINQDDFHLEANEIGIPLNYAEEVTISDKIEFRNESQRVNFAVAISRINPQIGTEAGLMQIKNPLIMVFTDQPSSFNTSGGITEFDLNTGKLISEISVPTFIQKLEQQARLNDGSLNTQARKNGYLSVLLSQVVLVEMSNQAHLQQYIGKKPDSFNSNEIDRVSNLLGVKYIQQIINRQSKPFIIVNKFQ